jgi:predicted amidohydrolase YtcJ
MDEDRNIYEALGVNRNKIEALGSNSEILLLKDSNTEIIDLKGKMVVPGFNDSHMHLLNYGYSLRQVNLIGTDSAEEINERVKEFISKEQIEQGKWIRGRGWNQDYFKDEKRFPTRYDLDKISTEYPIIVTRICGHVGVINSKALEILNIGKDTPQFEGGQFDLDHNGEPVGIFREMALTAVYNFIPEPSLAEVKHMMEIAITEMNKQGITSVGTDDFESLPGKNYDLVIKAYNELKSENKLNVRIYEQCLIPDIDKLEEFFGKGYKTGFGDEFLKIGPLKLLVDGSLGARTAALIKPYEDEKDNYGITLLNQEELDRLVSLSSEYNTHIIIHAIGDRAMYMAFESIEKELTKNPKKDHRHGIVHCQITDEALINKFKELDVVAYIQPIFLDYDWNMVKKRVGEDREKTSYNWKGMVDKRVKIACGSDAPVETFNVLYGIYEAVTRKDLTGRPKEGWLKDQALTVDEALYGYTMGGAFSSFEEDIKGSIKIGKLADIVVLSEDIFTIDSDDIKNIKIEKTIFNGNIIYEV